MHDPVNDILGDAPDGYSFSQTIKMNYQDSSTKVAVNYSPGDKVKTPAEISWSAPKLFGIPLAFSKSLAPDGSMTYEAAAGEDAHGISGADLKMGASLSGLPILSGEDVKICDVMADLTYSKINDTLVTLKTKPLDKEATLEITGKPHPSLTAGCKAELPKLTTPDLALALTSGPIFASCLATSKLSVFNFYFGYTINDDLSLGGTVQHGGDDSKAFSLGVAYKFLKAKVQQDQSISMSISHELAKGFAITAGGKYEPKSGSTTYGFSLEIE